VAKRKLDLSEDIDVAVRCVDVHKDYIMGKVVVHALRGVNLEVKKGEFMSILGPSGSGKSTLLNMVGALDRPTKGEVWIGNVKVSELDDFSRAYVRRKLIGFVFQAYYLIPHLTALQNVQIPMMLDGVSPSKRRKRAEELLKLVGLGHRVDNRPSELRGGEQQRVAIARALANNPAIVLADEPTGNLDTKTGAMIAELMKKINRERGVTFIIVTHNVELAEVTDRIVRLRDGVVVEDTGVKK